MRGRVLRAGLPPFLLAVGESMRQVNSAVLLNPMIHFVV